MPPETDKRHRFILPFLQPIYRGVAQPVTLLGLRVLIGAMLVLEGWPKIQAPFAMAGLTEAIGFQPAWLWSAALAVLQFFGGMLLVLGLLTRPIALMSGVMLAVTFWFHVTHPYGNVILTPEGISAFAGSAVSLFDRSSANPLLSLAQDGGAAFLQQVQFKAEGLSAVWTAVALFFAAHGAGALSVDRLIGREF